MATADEQIVETLRQQHHQFLVRLAAANDDLAERARRFGLDVHYDYLNDELLCTLGRPAESGTVSIGNTAFFRYDLDTLKIVGFGVLGLRAHRGENATLDRLANRALIDPGEAAQAARELVQT